MVKRHENFAYRGISDRPGSVLFPVLAKETAGLAIVSATSDEGCASDAVHLFDLRDEPLRDLTGPGIASVSSQDIGAAEPNSSRTR